MFRYLIVIFVWCKFVNTLSNTTIENVDIGNDLLYSLVQNCEKPTSSCIKNTIHDYLKDTLDYPDDIQFTSFLKFSKNSLNYQNTLSQSSNSTEDEIDSDKTPLEEVSRSLSDNTKKFLMTHNLEVSLPDSLFLGSNLKVSPLSFDSNGGMVKLEIVPRELDESNGSGRLFKKIKRDDDGPFSIISKLLLWSNVGKIAWGLLKFVGKLIGKFIGERLLFALLAILLVIKLLVVKFIFILPSLVGVVTAKKLIVKVLLFLFPFLHHLFKLCAATPYGAKHHIHKHQIAHIHQVAPPYHGHHKPPHYYEDPPGHHHFAHKNDYGNAGDSGSSGSEHGNEVYKDPPAEENEVGFWASLGFTQAPPKEETKKPMTHLEIENMVLKAEKEALIKSRLQKEQLRIHEENLKLQDKLNNAIKIQQKLKHHAVMVAHKFKPPKHKYHHFLPPPPHSQSLLPPPLPIPSTHHLRPTNLEFPPNNFVEPPLQYDTPPAFVDPQFQGSVSGPFAEPPSNYVEPHHEDEIPPGKIGAGLPTSAVDAVQSYISQKSQIHPVYQQNKLDQDQVTPQNFVTPQHMTQHFVTPQVTIDSAQSGQSFLPTPHQPEPSKLKPTANRKSDVPSQEEEFYKAAQITYDKFYSPILEKIDSVLNQLEFIDEPCRERLICSMYKNPEKFSPHSNLVSAELSRDAQELQKPTSTNSAVVRFYKYVQAARDGQDQRDCIRLYPACAINTEG